MKSILSWFFGTGKKLSKLKSYILNSVRGKLSEAIAKLWDSQIFSINKVQRLPSGTEVDFYRMQSGRPTFDNAIAFPNKSNELLIAIVDISIGKISKKIISQVWGVKGFIFCIEYDGPAEYFEEAMGMDPPIDWAVKCEIKNDLSFVALKI